MVLVASSAVGRYRAEAFWRVLGLLYLVVVLILAVPLAILFLAWMVVDVVWQAVTNRAGPEAQPSVFVRMQGPVIRLWEHIQHNTEWVLFGRGEFQWLP